MITQNRPIPAERLETATWAPQRVPYMDPDEVTAIYACLRRIQEVSEMHSRGPK